MSNWAIQRFTDALIEAGKARGLNPRTVLGSTASGPVAAWNGEHLLAALRRTGELLDDEFYGLAPHRCPLGTAQLGLEILTLSETLQAGIQRCSRLYGLATAGMRFELVEQGATATFRITHADPSHDRRHFLPEWHALRWHKLFQWAIADTIPIVRVNFQHAADDDAVDCAALFGAQCLYGQPFSGVTFDRSFLDRKIARRISDLKAELSRSTYDPEANQYLQSAWRLKLMSRLKSRLARDGAMPTIEDLAEDYGGCGQTLRRRLKQEGSSYRKVKAETRREIALSGMRDNTMTLAQISLMAGFAETNGLVRAVKGWTGLTPSELRRATVSDARPGGGRTLPRGIGYGEDASGLIKAGRA